MDTTRIMIILKGEPKTSKIGSYEFDSFANKYAITFKSGKTYKYNAQNVSILQNPIRRNPQNYRISYNGKQLGNISDIYIFKDSVTEYWHICCASGYEIECCKDNLKIEHSVLDCDGARKIFEYLREVADEVSLHTEDGDSILSNQYEKINFISDETAASIYLNPGEFQSGTDLDLSKIIFPFGCNESQYQAVCNALDNRISVIEGPPGTGKTQTILNIIANLVLQGKTIQIISNNNSAIDNVIEKMASQQYKVDFIAAQLGRAERKEAFIDNQTGCYPDISSWASDKYSGSEYIADLQKRIPRLREIFRDKNLLAELRQKLDAVKLEKKYYDDIADNKAPFLAKKPLTLEKLMEFWQEYQEDYNGTKKAGFLRRVYYYFFYGINFKQILKCNLSDVFNYVQGLYYGGIIEKINSRIEAIEKRLTNLKSEELINEFTEMSLKCFRAVLAKRYNYNNKREVFTMEDLWKNPNEFLKEYPVVLSTTYSARSSLGSQAQIDYVIMDEASQVDVVTGALSISCARNAVIVGDTKQLPNVVTSGQKGHLKHIFKDYDISKAYDFTKNSFLKSLCILLGERVPQVTLREHYRCKPQIIGFCNEKFYQGDLVVMSDQDSSSTLQLIMTDPGNYELNHTNKKQIEAIQNILLTEQSCTKSQIGIIAPYRNQVDAIEERLGNLKIDTATVHKFQGREKDVIILSTVDDIVTEFSDDPNLLNVAISRAKKKLFLVVSNLEQPIGSNIGDLIGYIRYINFDIQHSEIRPVFSFFYKKSAESRRGYLKKRRRILEADYETKIYEMLMEEIESRENVALDVICQQHMKPLFRDLSKMDDNEKKFLETNLPRLDYLIFNRVSKWPLLAIDIDIPYDKTNSNNRIERNELKSHILKSQGIPYLQISGNKELGREQLARGLNEVLHPSVSYTLVITEKPSVALTYAKVLGAQKTTANYWQGNGYIISWCYGHLVELADPEAYNEKYELWNIKDLPIIPEIWKYQISAKKQHKEQYNTLVQLMNRDDVTDILCATDAGREGELIFRLVYQQAGCAKPFRRIWLSSMEESSIKEAFANPKPSSDYDSLYEASRCRQLADWIVGMNASRYFSCLYSKPGEPLNVGRVLSPTLAMIVEREREIETFIPETYYNVNLGVGGVSFVSRSFKNEDDAIRVEQKCREIISAN